MSEFLVRGREIYIFTRPDGTFLAEKPKCARRVFPETNRINRSSTFSRMRCKQTATAAEMAWNSFQRQKNAEQCTTPEVQADFLDTTEQTIQDIDAFLNSITHE